MTDDEKGTFVRRVMSLTFDLCIKVASDMVNIYEEAYRRAAGRDDKLALQFKAKMEASREIAAFLQDLATTAKPTHSVH